jgi:hypothetical protein
VHQIKLFSSLGDGSLAFLDYSLRRTKVQFPSESECATGWTDIQLQAIDGIKKPGLGKAIVSGGMQGWR